MNILVTGINAMGAKAPARGYKINTSVVAVVDVLKQKNNVEQRPLEPGESLKGYDRVIVYPATIGGWSSGFAMGAFYACAVAADKLILALDDWQTATVRGSIEGFMKHVDKNFTKTNFFHRADEWKKYRSKILQGASRLAVQSQQPLMAPTFFGLGDLDDLGFPTGGTKFAFDPSIYFANQYTGAMEFHDNSREERWISSSLVNRSKWLETMRDSRWGVKSFGNKTAGDERIPEAELVRDWYGTSWGVLAPPTGQKTGMWWRARYQHAAEAGAIVAGDPDETSFCGEEYAQPPCEIERMGLGEIREYRDAQRERYYARRWSADRLVTELNKFVKSCLR